MSAEGLLDDPALFVRQKENVTDIHKIENDDEINKINYENNDEKKIKKKRNDDDLGLEKGKKKLKISCPDKLHLGLEYLELVLN